MDEFVKGDIVRHARTVEILSPSVRLTADVGDNRRKGWDVKDVQSGRVYFLGNDGSAKVEMVRRANRPKPKNGTVLKGADVKRVQWKRGTIIQCVQLSSGNHVNASEMVLCADGFWINLDERADTYEFDDLVDGARFKLIHVAE